ncbi:O-antigen/teichoic acid export membrane protein [Corynebacterium afermentans]
MKNLSLATIFAAASGFVVMWIASWALDAEHGYNSFLAYWGLFFACTGLIDGITQETTRAVAASRETQVRGNANPWKLGAAIGAALAVIALLAGLFTMGCIVPTHPGTATGLLAFGLLSYAFQAVLSGVLSGSGQWNRYAALVALDSGVRLVLAVVVWALGGGLMEFLAITVIGALSWAVILALAPVRVQLDVDRGAFVRRVGSAMVASGASAALITGFPTAASAAFPAATAGAAVAAINNAVMLTRAPVLVPLQRFQSALVVRFVERRDTVYRALVAPVGAIMGVGIVGFAAAWLIGPWILRVAYKPELFVDGLTLGLLTFASAFMGMLMITGVAVLALERHAFYVAGWLAATATAFAVLFLAPWDVAATVVVALFAGPIVGALVHLAGLVR